MKLNNRGFAITAILYGLLILFSLLVGSYLLALSAKKDRVDDIIFEIEEEYNKGIASCPTLPENITFPYQVVYAGTYVFSITSLGSSVTLDNCSVFLEEGVVIDFYNDTIYVSTSGTENYISFDDQDCYDVLYHRDVKSINSTYYLCE